jgi:hypothetical protein
VFLFSLAALTAGCDPPLDQQQYGEIVTELPKVEGAEKPYPLPKLEDPKKLDPQDQK